MTELINNAIAAYRSMDNPPMDEAAFIADFLAADVAPVRHGRWLTWEEKFPGQTPKKKNNLGVFCDQCKNHADNRTDFCPNCGAKMDGGDGA